VNGPKAETAAAPTPAPPPRKRPGAVLPLAPAEGPAAPAAPAPSLAAVAARALEPDWGWQLRNRISTLEQWRELLPLTAEEVAGLEAAPENFRVAVTPYYFSLIDRDHPSCPVRMQVIPRPGELVTHPGELIDPLGEDAHRPVAAIFHRYPDRCLLLALDRCAIYCRHCNRRRLVGQEESAISRSDLDDAIAYIRRTPAIRDVLISGGDPLTLSTRRLEEILAAVRAIDHVEVVRIGTRVPVVLPMRVDDELCAMLRRYHPLFINTHFNHPKELTPQARAACEKLADAGIPLGNQTVLLRGVNSSVPVLRALFTGLLRFRVRPYYLFQGDVAAGTGHLRTSVETGIALMEQLRGHISGLAIPHLVIDTPGGMGKVSIGPDYVLARGPDRWLLRNFEGREVEYPQAPEKDATCAYDEVYFSQGAAPHPHPLPQTGEGKQPADRRDP
jgi:lysine 2,3-aminomutase